MAQRVSFWTTSSRIVKWGLTNFWRNRLLSIATTLVMTITLVTISSFVILNLIIQTTINVVQQKIDLVVYFNDNVPDKDLVNLADEVRKNPDISQVIYVNKHDAFVRWQERQTEARLKNVVTEEDNPLPRSFEVKVINPDNLDKVASYFDAENIKPLVRKTSLNENRATIQRLVNVTRFIRKVGIAFSIFFVFISIMVVFNTIRLAIYSRRDEIDIMKLVGASPSYIRWPFLLEGILYGILATILSSILLYLAFRFLSPFANRYLGDIMIQWGGSFMIYFKAYLWEIILWQLLVGILIGLGCSYFAIRKHLKIA